jgi:hypothetical protein
MIKLFQPGDGPVWLRPFADSIVRAFKSIMDAPFRLWPAATADFPDPSGNGYGLVYDLSTNQVAYSDGSAWKQLFGSGNPALNAVAALSPAADRYIYFTSASAAALGTVTAFGRSILDDPDAAATRTTIGAEPAIAGHDEPIYEGRQELAGAERGRGGERARGQCRGDERAVGDQRARQ